MRSGSGIGSESVRFCERIVWFRYSGYSGFNSCCSCRCFSCSRRSGNCRMILYSCCRSVNSWSGVVLFWSGSSGSLG